MIIQQEKNLVESHGLLSSMEFKIDPNNTAFLIETLRRHLYKNICLATVRELFSNSFDAHREVNTPDLPIQVSLPNAWSNELKIKDFGPGINPSRMEDIFINFGSSTKRNDNKQLGGFGLGSKLILALSDSATITTIVDGIRYTYIAFIGDSKSGTMSLTNQVNTDEKNGTEICIPVPQKDIKSIIEQTFKVTQHWNVRPTILGLPEAEYQWVNYSPIIESDNWKIVKRTKNDYYGRTEEKATAILAGIPYNLTDFPRENLTEKEKYILDVPLFMYFSIGELSVSASRDNLHFNDSTIKAIKDRLSSVASKLEQEICDKIKNEDSYQKAALLYKDFYDTFGQPLVDSLNVTWQGYKLHTTINKHIFGKYALLSVYERNHHNEPKGNHQASYVNLTSNTTIVHNDKGTLRPGFPAINHLFNQGHTRVVVINTPKESASFDFEVSQAKIQHGTIPTLDYNFKFIEAFKPLKLTEIKIPAGLKDKKTRLVSDDEQKKGYVVRQNSKGGFDFIPELYDRDSEQLFVRADYHSREVYFSDGTRIWGGLIPLMKLVLNKDIIGISQSELDKDIPDDWVWADQALKEKVNEIVSSLGGIDELSKIVACHNRGSSSYDNINSKSLDDTSPFKQYITKYKDYKNKHVKYSHVFELLGRVENLNLGLPKINKSKFLEAELKKIDKRYPMLKHCSLYQDSAINEANEYIKLIDTVNGV